MKKKQAVSVVVIYTLYAIFVVAWLFQIIYYLLIMHKPVRHIVESTNTIYQPVTVVICAKNEARNLEKHLPLIFEQDFPDFQVVVVNDCSTDDTEMVLARFKEKHDNLYYTSIPTSKQFFQGKKLALTIGVKAAKHENLVLTDADCKPISDQWLKQMSNQLSDQTQIVVGHGRFEKQKSLFNAFLRYETFWNAVQFMGFAKCGMPFMAVGRNMAYKRSLFLNNNVFQKYPNIASGDDDLFMRVCANKTNTAIQPHYNSQTCSIAPANFSEWTTRKSRHLTTSVKYRLNVKAMLIGEVMTRQIFWLLTLCSLFFPTFAPYSLVLFTIRTGVQYVILGKAAKVMGENKLHFFTLLFDFITPMLIFKVWLINIFSANKKWK